MSQIIVCSDDVHCCYELLLFCPSTAYHGRCDWQQHKVISRPFLRLPPSSSSSTPHRPLQRRCIFQLVPLHLPRRPGFQLQDPKHGTLRARLLSDRRGHWEHAYSSDMRPCRERTAALSGARALGRAAAAAGRGEQKEQPPLFGGSSSLLLLGLADSVISPRLCGSGRAWAGHYYDRSVRVCGWSCFSLLLLLRRRPVCLSAPSMMPLVGHHHWS